MKSVIVEIKDGFAALLSDDGKILKVKNKNYVIGQVIEMKIQKVHITKKLALCVASAAVLLLTTGIGAWAYTTPYSYVSLDVNPSIEYTLNRFERVIDVKAVNDDGQVILDQIDIDGLTNESIEDAILATVNQINQDGYFGSTNTVSGSAIVVGDGTNTVTGSAITIDGGLVITVANGNTNISEELAAEILAAVQNFVGENVEVEAEAVGLERVQEARELGVTPGKLNLVQKLMASSDDPDNIVLEDWLDKPVKDIMKQIKENRKANPEEEDSTNETTATSEESTAASQAVIEESEENNDKNEEKATAASEKAEEKAAAASEKAQEKATAASEKAQEKATAASEKAQEKSDDASEKAQEKAAAASEKAQEKADDASEKAEEKANKNDDTAETTSSKSNNSSNSSKNDNKTDKSKGKN
ncbi:MAG: hypothetical protein K0R92_1203 [Lachnospiraceae bacterium]|jgi:hypothetical protein|nr:hypothetical protein [Lachnospiraceae bacterium]